ncbi:MAG: kynureninase [Ferruginibacter sp.]|nr:kynureninase [Ferruginibacter sp.]
MKHSFTLEYAQQMDQQDPLNHFRNEFYIPFINDKPCIYFTGNSLGLQPKITQDKVVDELEDWANYGVEGHLHARNPWFSYHEMFPPLLTDIVGANQEEIVVMNQLTVNLHLLMNTFYRPNAQRYKIICEAKAFPSDQYAIASQVKLHGFDPATSIIEIKPREGEHYIKHEDILAAIDKHGSTTALVLFGGVNYYTGQVFNMPDITRAAHQHGAYCGFDLAHAAGNVPLELHHWDIDFATWCSYKYLNSGPGGVSGVFIHQRHATNKKLPRLAGWWGHNKDTRFKMPSDFDPTPTAEGWQLSNAPIFSMAAHRAGLEIFKQAGFNDLVSKSRELTGYLFFVLNEVNASFSQPVLEIITPQKQNEYGCQVSIMMKQNGKLVFDTLQKEGVIADWREPDVIRVAPVPLYNTFEDVFHFAEIIKRAIS